MTKKNNEQVNASKILVNLTIKEFRGKYPNLDLKNLKVTSPASLQNVDLTGKEIVQIRLHPVVLSVICGTVFGDSNLAVQKGYKKARLSYRHSTRQTEWFLWKTLCVLQDFITENSVQFQMPDGHQAKSEKLDNEHLGKLKVSTCVNEKLTLLRDIIAPNNEKTIKRHWLNHMNNYFLMTLWLDDGGFTGTGGRQGVISTGSMPLDQAEVLADYLKTVWDINCEARYLMEKKMKNGELLPNLGSCQTRIFIKDQENLLKLLRIVAPIIPIKSMLYKVCFFPIDVSLQQRWASELKQLVRAEWHDTLDLIFAYKKLESIFFLTKKESKSQKKI